MALNFILLDDSNRKTICRLYLNRSKKYITLLNEARRELGQKISCPYSASHDDIFSHADGLKEVVGRVMEGRMAYARGPVMKASLAAKPSFCKIPAPPRRWRGRRPKKQTNHLTIQAQNPHSGCPYESDSGKPEA